MTEREAIANIEYARKWLGSESDFSEKALDIAISALEKDGNWCQFRWSSEHVRAVVGAWKPLPEPYTEEEA